MKKESLKELNDSFSFRYKDVNDTHESKLKAFNAHTVLFAL